MYNLIFSVEAVTKTIRYNKFVIFYRQYTKRQDDNRLNRNKSLL